MACLQTQHLFNISHSSSNTHIHSELRWKTEEHYSSTSDGAVSLVLHHIQQQTEVLLSAYINQYITHLHIKTHLVPPYQMFLSVCNGFSQSLKRFGLLSVQLAWV